MEEKRSRRRPAGESRGNYGRQGGQSYGPEEQQGYYDQGEGPQGYYDPNGGQGYYDQGGQSYYGPEGQQGYYDQGGGPQGYYGQGGPQGYYDQGGQGYYGPEGQQGYYGQGGPQNYYEEPEPGRKKKKKKGRKKYRKAIFAVEIIVLLVLALGLFGMVQLNRMDRVKLRDIIVNSGITKSGYRNIALFGVDSREGRLDSGTNSDTIIIASINNKTGDVKLASVYRDTYLDRTDGTYGKATECYASGGGEQSVSMLNKNLDLDIKDFVTVDFKAIIDAVDLLGGIELDITEEELKWLNGYLVETSQVTGVSYEELPAAGYQHVTGIQAMAYCRIRYTEGWDYKRTERQRTVLSKILEKAQAQGVTGLMGMVDSMLPNIATSLSNTELLSLATGIAKYSIADSFGFPFDKQAADIAAGDCVVPVNLAQNVTQLHAQLFGDENYTPSATVQEISNTIINNTGIQ